MEGFWAVHGIVFVLCMFFFPRVTLLLATVWGGLLWWLGLVFVPRLTVAILALPYYDTNPILVILTWIWALSGETAEKSYIPRTETTH